MWAQNKKVSSAAIALQSFFPAGYSVCTGRARKKRGTNSEDKSGLHYNSWGITDTVGRLSAFSSWELIPVKLKAVNQLDKHCWLCVIGENNCVLSVYWTWECAKIPTVAWVKFVFVFLFFFSAHMENNFRTNLDLIILSVHKDSLNVDHIYPGCVDIFSIL